MKKLNYFLLLMLVMGTMIASCSSKGKQATTSEAEKVELVKTANTITLNKIKTGSALDWKAAHLGGVQPRSGKIYAKTANLQVTDGKLTNAKIDLDMNSLTVTSFPAGAPEIEKLTGHLKASDFFDVEKFPISTFELTKMQKGTGDYNSRVTGNLTILGVTKSISFSANTEVSNSSVSINSEDFTINRMDWGLTYNAEGTAGVPVDYLIAKDIGFTINLVVRK